MPNFGDPYEKGRELLALVETDIRDRQPALRTKETIRNLYYGMNLRKKRYPGQSDIHLYVVAEKIENVIAKEMNAFFSIDPHVHVLSQPPMIDDQEAKDAERITNWAVDSDIPDFYKTFEGWLRNRHLDSVAAVKVWYNFEERNTLITEITDKHWQAGKPDLMGIPVPEPRIKLPVEVLASVLVNVDIVEATRNGKPIDPFEEQELEGLAFVVNFEEGRLRYRGIAVELRESRHIDEIMVAIHRPVTVKDNVEVDLIEFEDLIVPARTRDLQSAERLAQKHWQTAAQVQQKRLTEGWDITDSELERIKNRGSSERQERHSQDSESLKNQKDRVTGHRRFPTSSTGKKEGIKPYIDDKALFFEIYATEDLDGDGIFEEVIYQVSYGLEKVVHAQYLEEVCPHGHRPFADLHSIPISNRYYGWSLGQVLMPINLEVDAIVNMVNDAQELITNPFFFYVPTALMSDEKALRNLRPGQGVPINDPNGFFIPQFPQQPLANLSTLDSMLLYADKMTVSPQAYGSSQVRNAPRTARGTLALLSEAGIKVDSYITAAQKSGWGELMYQIHALYDHYGSDDILSAVVGHERPKRSSTKDLRDRVKFLFKGNTVNTNREVMAAKAQMIYNTLMVNPLYATDPLALRNVTEFFLKNVHDGGDIEKLLPQLPPGFSRKPMSQEEELQVIAMGMPVDVLPSDDHAGHLQKIFQFENSKMFGDWTELQVGLLAAHALQHRRALSIAQQQGAVDPGATQANNIPQGVTQDLNALEGGVQ